jgi:putative ATP-dependent endonuclease of OLD family
MGYDVIECRGLAFRRILDIAAPVERRVAVVTDNDGVPERKREAYSDLEGAYARVFLGGDASLRTLEPQIVGANGLETINAALRRDFDKKDQAIDWMLANKTEAAVRIFDAEIALNPPTYMQEALTWLVD